MSVNVESDDSYCELHVGNTYYKILLPHATTDYIQGRISGEGQPYEHAMLEDMASRVQPGQLILDVGANIGNHALYMAMVSGSEVIAFEPNAELCDALRRSINENGAGEHMTVRQCAVGAANGKGRFAEIHVDNLGAQSVKVGEGDIDVITLDSLAFDAPVKLVKIDVEGMELDVLRGASKLLEKDRPLIYVECLDEGQFFAVNDHLAALGYGYWETFNATPTHLFVPNEQTTPEQLHSRLSHAVAQGIYHTGFQLHEAQQRLGDANHKYRTATEKVALYKSQVSDLAADKLALETDLAAIKQRFDATSADHRSAADRVAALKAQMEKNLAALDAARHELNEARNAASEYGRRLAENEHELSVRQALSEQADATNKERLDDWQRWAAELESRTSAELARVQEETASVRHQLEEAQAKFQRAVGDNRVLELRASTLDAELGRVQAERERVQKQLTSLNAKQANLVSRAEKLSADLNDQRVAQLAAEAEAGRERAHLTAEIKTLRDLSGNQSNDIVRLNAEIAALNTSLADLEDRRIRESAALRQECDQYAEQCAALRAERSNQDETIAQLDAEIQRLRDVEEAARRKTAELEEQLAHRLEDDVRQNHKIAELASTYDALNALRERESTDFAQYRADTELMIDALESTAREYTERIDRLTGELDTLESELARRSETIGKLTTEIESASELSKQQEQLHTDGLASLQEKIDALQAERGSREAERQELRSTLSVQRSESKASISTLERIKLDAVRHKVALTEANAHVERLRQQLIAANQQVLRTKNTLSFQLGHALIFGTKSWGGFFALPGKLLAIHKLSRQRRHEKSLKGQKTGHARPAVPGISGPRRSEIIEHVADAARARLQGLHDDNGQQLAHRMKQLKVAAIMDEFTFGSYDPECNLLQLTPTHWQTELSAFSPDMLFIESAWRGKDDLWGSKVGHMSQEVVGIVQWCRDHKIPTIFWNKEDPVHFETFLSTAKLFDFVFTTDIDCIHRYKSALGHERVYLLPFAAQPIVNNPIEKYERKDAFCFAGAYYVRYPERTRDLGNFIVNLPEYRPLEIYDRNYGKNDSSYQFPEEYQPFIVGNLPYSEIDKAYKGYKYAINLNSIKQSQSMFARRVFELLASNTITVSNFSRGVRLMFGDLVVTSDSGSEIRRRLDALGGDEAGTRKLRLAALRKVMREHTYQDRLAYVISKVSEEKLPSLLPQIVVIGYAKDQVQTDRILQSFARQRYESKTLVLIVPEQFSPTGIPDGDTVRVLSALESDTVTLPTLASPAAWLSVMVADDHYGEHYLTDLALATRYSNALAIGKVAQYVWSSSKGLSLIRGEAAYKHVQSVPARAGIARLDTLPSVTLREWMREPYTAQFESDAGFAVDEFNYCRSGVALDDAGRAAVDDAVMADQGLTLAEIQKRAEAIEPEKVDSAALPQLRGGDLAAMLTKAPANSRVSMVERGGCLQVDSALPDGTHEYWYADRDFEPSALSVDNGHLRFHLETTPGLNLQITVLFLDAAKTRIGHVVKAANRNHDVELPANTAYLRLGLRVYAGGSARVQSLLLGHRSLLPADVFAQGQHLVLTNHYPSYDDLYRNGFVHSRVRGYREHGVRSDVFRFRAEQMAEYQEFENIDVMTGGADVLNRLLETGRYRSVLVHFLDEAMWQVLKQHADRMKIVVWAHGADIQSFERRAFLYDDGEQRTAAAAKSEKRLAFWRDVLNERPSSLHLVFVSQYLATTAMEDLGVVLPNDAYSVIHNPIDTRRFNYVEKDVELRKKVLSIRPYASKVYGNDLSVRAILALSDKPGFSEMQFHLVGDGVLFDETVEPLRAFPNVRIERRFLTQREIADLHKEYGIFLCPSRMDTQGVSRDEAMASGLVPVTNSVAAIPEFVDESCGVLAPEEDADAIAAGMLALAENPDRFVAMSVEAARRVRRQSGHELVIEREIACFRD
ncbi:FkbM family methyltransferase [Burkholderia sp. Ac-20353]|uniref:FkbM family methyltransferase n=1 Tax=Burkholderia sp. Ac-20353 TaxID=2703894 RepID=UPI00197BFD15|nr:FkbM family methyltransferase [Burkholderia sp. Ac-20353]MBN3789413.1 FkbM family methyltransferase [Burkholderia sp. Ac-20353]